MKLVDAIVKPILTFASDVWCQHFIKQIYNANIHKCDSLAFEKLYNRGDWGTLRRKNSNPPNTDLIFKIKYFDDTYGYSIQWGIFEQEMKIIRNV